MQVLEQEQAAEKLLRAQIVDDPEHVRRVIADMRESAAREVSAAAAAHSLFLSPSHHRCVCVRVFCVLCS